MTAWERDEVKNARFFRKRRYFVYGTKNSSI